MTKNFTFPQRYIAAITLITFIFSHAAEHPAWAMGNPSAEISAAAESLLWRIRPSRFAHLDRVIQGSKDRIIFHVQEAHGDVVGQKNLPKLLEELKTQYGIEKIFLEGSAFQLHPERLRFDSDPKQNREILKLLAERSIASGTEVFLAGHPGITIQGLEEISPYVQNGRAMLEVMKGRQENAGNLQALRSRLDHALSEVSPKSLRDFLRQRDGFERGRLPIESYLRLLKDRAQENLNLDLDHSAEQIEWPMLVRIFKLKQIEAEWSEQDFKSERGPFLRLLEKWIPQKKSGGLFEQVQNFLNASEATASVSGLEAEQIFEAAAARLTKAFPFARFQNVNRLIARTLLASDLRSDALAEEIGKLGERIALSLAEDETAKSTIRFYRQERLLEKLVALELTPDELRRLRSAQIGTGLFDSPDLSLARGLKTFFEKALHFYDLAEKRDQSMIRRLDAELAQSGVKRAAVITGGFHALPMEDHFKNLGATYLRFTPRMSNAANDKKYFEFVNRYFHPAKSTWKTPPFLASTPAELYQLGWFAPDWHQLFRSSNDDASRFTDDAPHSFQRSALRKNAVDSAANNQLTLDSSEETREKREGRATRTTSFRPRTSLQYHRQAIDRQLLRPLQSIQGHAPSFFRRLSPLSASSFHVGSSTQESTIQRLFRSEMRMADEETKISIDRQANRQTAEAIFKNTLQNFRRNRDVSTIEEELLRQRFQWNAWALENGKLDPEYIFATYYGGPQGAMNLLQMKMDQGIISWSEILVVLEFYPKVVERIYVDLDDTLFTTKSYVGSEQWLRDQVDAYGRKVRSIRGEKHFQEERLLEEDMFETVEPGLAERLRSLQDKGIEVIGLTARFPQTKLLTERILKQLGIEIPVLYAGSGSLKKEVLHDEIEAKDREIAEENRDRLEEVRQALEAKSRGMQSQAFEELVQENTSLAARGRWIMVDDQMKKVISQKYRQQLLEAGILTFAYSWQREYKTEEFLKKFQEAQSKDQVKTAVAHAIDILSMMKGENDPGKRFDFYLLLGPFVRDQNQTALTAAYIESISDFLAEKYEEQVANPDPLLHIYFKLVAEYNSDAFVRAFKAGEVSIKRVETEGFRHAEMNYEILINEKNIFLFLQPLIEFLKVNNPEVLILPDTGARPFKELMEEVITREGLRTQIVIFPLSRNMAADTTYEVRRWMKLISGEIQPLEEEVRMVENLKKLGFEHLSKARSVAVLDDNITTGETIEIMRDVLSAEGVMDHFVALTPFAYRSPEHYGFPVVTTFRTYGNRYGWMTRGTNVSPPVAVLTAWEYDYEIRGARSRTRFTAPPTPSIISSQGEEFRRRLKEGFVEKYRDSPSISIPESRGAGYQKPEREVLPLELSSSKTNLAETIDLGQLELHRRTGAVNDLAWTVQEHALDENDRIHLKHPDVMLYEIRNQSGDVVGVVLLALVLRSDGELALVLRKIQPRMASERKFNPKELVLGLRDYLGANHDRCQIKALYMDTTEKTMTHLSESHWIRRSFNHRPYSDYPRESGYLYLGGEVTEWLGETNIVWKLLTDQDRQTIQQAQSLLTIIDSGNNRKILQRFLYSSEKIKIRRIRMRISSGLPLESGDLQLLKVLDRICGETDGKEITEEQAEVIRTQVLYEILVNENEGREENIQFPDGYFDAQEDWKRHARIRAAFDYYFKYLWDKGADISSISRKELEEAGLGPAFKQLNYRKGDLLEYVAPGAYVRRGVSYRPNIGTPVTRENFERYLLGAWYAVAPGMEYLITGQESVPPRLGKLSSGFFSGRAGQKVAFVGDFNHGIIGDVNHGEDTLYLMDGLIESFERYSAGRRKRSLGWLDVVRWLRREEVIPRESEESRVYGRVTNGGKVIITTNRKAAKKGILHVGTIFKGEQVVGVLAKDLNHGCLVKWYLENEMHLPQSQRKLLNVHYFKDGEIHLLNDGAASGRELGWLDIVKWIEEGQVTPRAEDASSIRCKLQGPDGHIFIKTKMKNIGGYLTVGKSYDSENLIGKDIRAVLEKDMNHGTLLKFYFEEDMYLPAEKRRLINLYYFENGKPKILKDRKAVQERNLGWLDIKFWGLGKEVQPRADEQSSIKRMVRSDGIIMLQGSLTQLRFHIGNEAYGVKLAGTDQEIRGVLAHDAETNEVVVNWYFEGEMILPIQQRRLINTHYLVDGVIISGRGAARRPSVSTRLKLSVDNFNLRSPQYRAYPQNQSSRGTRARGEIVSRFRISRTAGEQAIIEWLRGKKVTGDNDEKVYLEGELDTNGRLKVLKEDALPFRGRIPVGSNFYPLTVRGVLVNDAMHGTMLLFYDQAQMGLPKNERILLNAIYVKDGEFKMLNEGHASGRTLGWLDSVAWMERKEVQPRENEASQITRLVSNGRVLVKSDSELIGNGSIPIGSEDAAGNSLENREVTGVLEKDINHGIIMLWFYKHEMDLPRGKRQLLNITEIREGEFRMMEKSKSRKARQSRQVPTRSLVWLDLTKWLREEPIQLREKEEDRWIIGKVDTNGRFHINRDDMMISSGFMISKTLKGVDLVGVLNQNDKEEIYIEWYFYDPVEKKIGDMIKAHTIRQHQIVDITEEIIFFLPGHRSPVKMQRPLPPEPKIAASPPKTFTDPESDSGTLEETPAQNIVPPATDVAIEAKDVSIIIPHVEERPSVFEIEEELDRLISADTSGWDSSKVSPVTMRQVNGLDCGRLMLHPPNIASESFYLPAVWASFVREVKLPDSVQGKSISAIVGFSLGRDGKPDFYQAPKSWAMLYVYENDSYLRVHAAGSLPVEVKLRRPAGRTVSQMLTDEEVFKVFRRPWMQANNFEQKEGLVRFLTERSLVRRKERKTTGQEKGPYDFGPARLYIPDAHVKGPDEPLTILFDQKDRPEWALMLPERAATAIASGTVPIQNEPWVLIHNSPELPPQTVDIYSQDAVELVRLPLSSVPGKTRTNLNLNKTKIGRKFLSRLAKGWKAHLFAESNPDNVMVGKEIQFLFTPAHNAIGIQRQASVNALEGQQSNQFMLFDEDAKVFGMPVNETLMVRDSLSGTSAVPLPVSLITQIEKDSIVRLAMPQGRSDQIAVFKSGDQKPFFLFKNLDSQKAKEISFNLNVIIHLLAKVEGDPLRLERSGVLKLLKEPLWKNIRSHYRVIFWKNPERLPWVIRNDQFFIFENSKKMEDVSSIIDTETIASKFRSEMRSGNLAINVSAESVLLDLRRRTVTGTKSDSNQIPDKVMVWFSLKWRSGVIPESVREEKGEEVFQAMAHLVMEDIMASTLKMTMGWNSTVQKYLDEHPILKSLLEDTAPSQIVERIFDVQTSSKMDPVNVVPMLLYLKLHPQVKYSLVMTGDTGKAARFKKILSQFSKSKLGIDLARDLAGRFQILSVADLKSLPRFLAGRTSRDQDPTGFLADVETLGRVSAANHLARIAREDSDPGLAPLLVAHELERLITDHHLVYRARDLAQSSEMMREWSREIEQFKAFLRSA